MDHVLFQAAVQQHVDNACSKTCNLPNAASVEDVKNIYTRAWQLGLKGLTIYRTNSRVTEVLMSVETAQSKQGVKRSLDSLPVVVMPNDDSLSSLGRGSPPPTAGDESILKRSCSSSRYETACPECSSGEMHVSSGCVSCLGCGWGRCG